MIRLLTPGPGRRQAEPSRRLAAENARLADRITELENALYAADLRVLDLEAELAQVQDGYTATRSALDTATRANAANAEAVTVKIDVQALRAAPADEFTETRQPLAANPAAAR